MKLPVPENIPLRWELWRGFGMPELIRSAVIFGVVLTGCIAFAYVSTWPGRQIAAVLTAIFSLFFCFGFFVKTAQQNQSIYDFLMLRRRYRRSQQTYRFKREEEMIHYDVSEEKRAG